MRSWGSNEIMSITLLLQCQARSNKHSMLYLVVFLLNLISIKRVLQTAFHHPLITISVFTKIFLVVSTKKHKNKWKTGTTRLYWGGDAEWLSRCIVLAKSFTLFYTSSKWMWFKFIPQQYDKLYTLWTLQGHVWGAETGNIKRTRAPRICLYIITYNSRKWVISASHRRKLEISL